MLCAAAAVGCKGGGGSARPASDSPRASSFGNTTSETLAAARLEATSAADTYVTILAQADDELRARTRRPELVEWAMRDRVATALACYTNASGPNGFVGLLDMMVYATLKREAIENHWIPTLLHEEGAPVLDAARRAEQSVWNTGARVLTKAQRDELRKLIEDWREDNPTQYYVSHIRFSDFASALSVTAASPQVKLPGNVFGLLYIDPLAGLDPVTRELQQYRALTERLAYTIYRMPIVMSWQVDLAVFNATHDPQVVRFIDNTSKFSESSLRFGEASVRFADSTKRLVDAVVRFPRDLTAERTAAVEQLDAVTERRLREGVDRVFVRVDEQRKAMVRDIEAQESRARAVVADVRGVVERADEAGRSLGAATGQTIGTAEDSVRRTMNHGFALAVALVVVTLLALLLYRLATKRWVVRPAASPGSQADPRNSTSSRPLDQRRIGANSETG